MKYCKILVITILSTLVLSACGSSSSSGGTQLQPPSTDLTGTWTITSGSPSNTCGDTNQSPIGGTVTVSQSGNTISSFMVNVGGISVDYSGTISGNSINVSATYSEDAGTVNESFTGTVQADDNTVTGSDTWTWSDGASSCSGATNGLTLTRDGVSTTATIVFNN